VEPFDPELPGEPPADPEDWTDEQWIAWLEATDPAPRGGRDGAAPPATTVGRITHSTGGHLLGQAMLGLADAISGRNHDEVVVVVDADTEEDADEPFRVRLDPEHPERSSVVFRPGPGPSQGT